MEILTTTNKKELWAQREGIELLFGECFGGRKLGELWMWAYMENPGGDPIVALCFDENRLVGHYAIISMPIISSTGQLNSYLSMTTMVSESHRKFGLFPKLAAETYRVAVSMGVEFVMGFPNAMSTPGFRKRLNWDFPQSDYVAKVSKAELLASSSVLLSNPNGGFLNLENKQIISWRMSKPEAHYTWDCGLLYKSYDNEIDVLYFESAKQLEKLPDGKLMNILVRGDTDKLRAAAVFDYQFGGVSLNGQFEPSLINRQLCLSDVF